MSSTANYDLIDFTDETGKIFDRRLLLQEARVGEPIRKRVTIKNRNVLPIQLENPEVSDPNLTIISYPRDRIAPGGTGKIVLEYNLPKTATAPPEVNWDFDVRIFSGG